MTDDPQDRPDEEHDMQTEQTPSTTHYRWALALAVATVLFLVLGIGALGIIGDGGRADQLYLVVPVVLLVGAAVARLRARGMALALTATALAQLGVTVVALVAGLPEDASLIDVLGINAMYAGLFGLSAWLFRRAADGTVPVGVAR